MYLYQEFLNFSFTKDSMTQMKFKQIRHLEIAKNVREFQQDH